MGLIGLGGDVVRRLVGAPRVSVRPTRRTAAADYMAGAALVQRLKRAEQDLEGFTNPNDTT